MITVLLLDPDGVLRIWDPQLTDAVEATYRLPPGSLLTAARSPERLEKVLTGQMDDQAWRDSLTEDIVREHGESARPAIEEWLLPVGQVDTDALAVVRHARSVLRVLLLTNASNRHGEDLEELGLAGEVDGWLSSSDLGLAKPDPDVFSRAALRHHLMFSEIAYVDTKPANIATAEILGIHSHLYEDAEGLRTFVDGVLAS